MKRKHNRLGNFLILAFIFTIICPLALAGQIDAQIQNYAGEPVVIEFRQVKIGGEVQWKPIGKVSQRSARIFRNVTIGSVIRAKAGSKVLGEFTINRPPVGSNIVVLTVKPD